MDQWSHFPLVCFPSTPAELSPSMITMHDHNNIVTKPSCCDGSTNWVSSIVATLLHVSGSLSFDWFLDWNSGSLPYTSNIFHTLRVEGTQGRKEIEREDVWSSCHNNPSYQCYAFSPPSSCVCPPHTFSSCQIDTLHTPYS